MSARTTIDKERVDTRWTPWHAQLDEWRWWLVVGVAAAIGLGIAWIAGLVIGFYVDMEMDARPLWYLAVVYAPFAVAALATAAIAGARRWWSLVPSGVVFVLLLLEPGELSGDAFMTRSWAAIVWG